MHVAVEETVGRPSFSAVSGYISTLPRTSTVSGNTYPSGTLRKKQEVFDFRSAINFVSALVDDLNNTPDKAIITALKPDQWRNQLEIELANLQPITDQFIELTKVYFESTEDLCVRTLHFSLVTIWMKLQRRLPFI